MRKNVSSGSPFEGAIGFSRSVRVGPYVAVAGTAPVGSEEEDSYEQTKRCLEIIGRALAEAGASLTDVVRTRVMLSNIEHWQDAARAHGEVFGEIRPACTFVEVSRFIDERWHVELEADAYCAQ